jgi:hypothetical protein
MGMIICEKHGMTGISINILKDICEKILENEPIAQEELATILVDYYDEDTFLITDRYLVTNDFKREYQLRGYYKISSDEEDQRLWRPIAPMMGGLCGKCYKEYLAEHNIKVPNS